MELPLPVDTALATAVELPSCCGVIAGAGGVPEGAGGATCGFHRDSWDVTADAQRSRPRSRPCQCEMGGVGGMPEGDAAPTAAFIDTFGLGSMRKTLPHDASGCRLVLTKAHDL